jgi:hypothetical protein
MCLVLVPLNKDSTLNEDMIREQAVTKIPDGRENKLGASLQSGLDFRPLMQLSLPATKEEIERLTAIKQVWQRRTQGLDRYRS